MALTTEQQKMKEAVLALLNGGHLSLNDYSILQDAYDEAASPQAILAILAQLEQVQGDAARFALAIALDDNAEALYAAVMSNSPNGALIRAQFDADMALSPLPPPPEAA